MSEEDKALEFSARDFMPDWVRDMPGKTEIDRASRAGTEHEDRSERPSKRGSQRGGKSSRFEDEKPWDRDRGFGREGQRSHRDRDDRRPQPAREGGSSRGRSDRDDSSRPSHRGGRDRSDRPRRDDAQRGATRRGDDRYDSRGDRQRGHGRRDDYESRLLPAEGVVATIEPSGPSIEGLINYIRSTHYTFPLYDLAKVVMKEGKRYTVRFTASDPIRLYQCRDDHSLWLTRQEAFSHITSWPYMRQHYVEEEVQVDPPKGSYSVIAVCGMSGVILGPPNHHKYQQNIAKLHRERFSHLSLERFKSRIQMESEPDKIEAWKEQESKTLHYKIKAQSGDAIDETDAAQSQEGIDSSPQDHTTTPEEEVVVSISTEAEAASTNDEPNDPTESVGGSVEESDTVVEESADETTDESTTPEEEASTSIEAESVFTNLDEVRQHFLQNYADGAIEEVSEAVVPGNIQGRRLSSGLLEHLKIETRKLRTGFPLPIIRALENEFRTRGLHCFRLDKKKTTRYVSLVVPKGFAANDELTDSIRAIVDYLAETAKPSVTSLLESFVPGFRAKREEKEPKNKEKATEPAEETLDDPDAEAPSELSVESTELMRSVLRDLRWLITAGYVVEFPDKRLVLGRPRKATPTAQEKDASTGILASPEFAVSTDSGSGEGELATDGKKRKQRRRRRSKLGASATSVMDISDTTISNVDMAISPEGIHTEPNDPYELPESVNPVADPSEDSLY